MIKNYIKDADLLAHEPAFNIDKHEGQAGYESIIQQSYKCVLDDVKKKNWELKQLCIPLILQDTVTNAVATEGAISTEDVAERLRLVVEADGGEYILKGSNDKLTFTDILTVEKASDGEVYTEILPDVYKYYRFDKTDAVSTTYKAFLVETTFDHAILYHSLYLASKSLAGVNDDIWDAKAVFYIDKYKNEMETIKPIMDTDESGTIEDTDEQANIWRFKP